ncbi:MAG: pteridine-dependent deoxygenase [Rhodanobacteraceae bacterium]|jgi:chorismate lyase/3-hydroxybenzoate synthase|nr:MAG: pteridine-dependent deoxygenase [Rhodanobacteraceae bacterium]
MTGTGPGWFHVEYRDTSAQALLDQPGTLAVFSFAPADPDVADPRHLHVLQTALSAHPVAECWTVAGDVSHGREGDLRWSRGAGWQFTAIEVDETRADIEAACTHAYDRLLTHLADSFERHLLRVWNYLDAINAGDGDAERYRRFCSARAQSMAAHGLTRYPAATAIGHRGPRGRLQVYALSATADGTALENPRQVSAWAYPRQYGPTAPSFARAMLLPRGGLAISGTAAVIGHASHHAGDVTAQVDEAVANLEALLERAALPAFDALSPLKVYVRHPQDVDAVGVALARHLDPSVPRLFLQGDVCRRELLVEIDGWSGFPR